MKPMKSKPPKSLLIVPIFLFALFSTALLLWLAPPGFGKTGPLSQDVAKTPDTEKKGVTPVNSSGASNLARMILQPDPVAEQQGIISNGVKETIKGRDYPYKEIDNSICLGCHGSQINEKKFAESVHGSQSCTGCHYDITDVSAHAEAMQKKGAGIQIQPVKCQWCHDEEAIEFNSSVHSLNEVQCTDCHTNIHELSAWKGDKKRVIQTCETCHPEEGERYSESVHGKGTLAENPDSPDCTDCHGQNKSLHNIPVLKGKALREFHTEACAVCHADKKMMKRNKVLPIATQTYYESYHGKIEELGYPRLVAGCSDCHRAHEVLPEDNPKSSISPQHLVGTCGKCHPQADVNFVEFDPHANYENPKNPVLYWTFLLMHGLLISVFAAFWTHTALWWRKDFWEQRELRVKGIFFPHLVSPDEEGRIYRRFTTFDIVLHFSMMLSFMGLVLTGIPLEFSGAPWARGLVRLLGGSPMRGLIHRTCAVIISIAFGITVVYVFYFLFVKKMEGNPGFFQRLFGPDSLFPRWKDFKDLYGMVRWFFNKGPKPRFDRWTYWEKFDFFAVFWGMFAIGLSGFMLWFRGFFTIFLPGWMLNAATIVHSDEALLAAGFIFTIHFFNNHFRPSNFPINTVIFTGRLPKYKLIEERSMQYERMMAEGTLEPRRDRYPSVGADLFYEITGFFMLFIGLLCLFLIGWRILG